MSGPGYYYPEDQVALDAARKRQAYAQALIQSGGTDPGNTPYSGVAHAGQTILGAFLARKAGDQESNITRNAQERSAKDYGEFLRRVSGQTSSSLPQTGASALGAQLSGKVIAPQGPMAGPASIPAQSVQTQPALAQGPQNPIAALADIGNPALMAQFGPSLIQHQLEMGDKATERQWNLQDHKQVPLTADETAQLGLPRGTVAAKDGLGAIHIINKPDYMSDDAFKQKVKLSQIQQAPQWAQLAESSRHNKVEEGIAQNPFGTGIGVPGASGKTGDEFLKALPPGLASQIKAVGTYRQPAPAGRTSPTGIKFMTLVNQAFPDYDASSYGAKTKARNDFTTGKNGNTVRSLNVAVQHLDQLGQLSQALGNGNVQAFNSLGQSYAQQTGKPAPNNFDAAKQLVADEVVKAVVGAGGGVSDREGAANTISRANSPQQLAGVIQTYQGLLSGQLSGLKQQYEKSTGLNDFEDFLSQETRQKLQGHSQQGKSRFKIEQVQ